VRLVGAEEQTGMYLPPSQVGFSAAGTYTGYTFHWLQLHT
jgi:hypothetical protein